MVRQKEVPGTQEASDGQPGYTGSGNPTACHPLAFSPAVAAAPAAGTAPSDSDSAAAAAAATVAATVSRRR